MRLPERGLSHVVLAVVVATAAARAATGPDAAEIGLDPGLDGEAIYARVIANRFDAFVQESTLASGDRTGRVQRSRFEMYFRDFRGDRNRTDPDLLSKTLVKYTHPFDLRHAGYLVIQNESRPADQFVYLPTRRQTVRVNLRGEAVFGTDFSFEDVIPRELGDATYRRLDDSEVEGRPVYVVEALPTATYDSEYSKLVFFVDPGRFVPLRTRYWDEAGVPVKELSTRPGDMERFGEVWVPMRARMRHLQLETYTVLEIERLEPGRLPPKVFELRRLEAH